MRKWVIPAVLLTGLVIGLVGVMPAAQSSSSTDPNRWALVIGIDHYQGRTHPNVGAVGDTRAVRQALTQHGWADDHVLVLTDGQATQDGIRRGLAWLRDHAVDGSFSVVHYSGHVHQTQSGSTLHQELWPADNRFVSDTELAQAVGQVRGRLWVDIAGCEGGGFDEGISSENRLFTSSSAVDEKSYEYPDWHESVFTGLLVDQGILQGKADADRDGRVSIQEAFRYAADRAPQMTANQSAGPQHPEMRGGDGNQWFLDPPPPPPPNRGPLPLPTG